MPLGGDTWEETAQLLCRYPRTEFFELVGLYSGDGHKIKDHSDVTLREETQHGNC